MIPIIYGSTEPAFIEVQKAFQRNFERGEDVASVNLPGREVNLWMIPLSWA